MAVPALLALDGVIRDYAWGSTTAIQTLLGLEPDGRRAAELWFGAHPDDPARVPERDTTLDKIIDADPAVTLGPDDLARFGPRLPFLLKVLAADKALSLQVHPTLAQARAGYADEQARGIAADAPERNYRDSNHKPELLCALTTFTALCGFRPPARTVQVIDELPASVGAALAQVRADLVTGDESAALRAAFVRLLTLDESARADLVERVVSGCRGIVSTYAPLARFADGAVGAARVVDLCAHDFPGDIGAVLSLLLNPVVLQPGQAIYLGAGNVHAYLRGSGVEIMANSDNVLRCGLTPKHVDVPELVKITDFTALEDPRRPAADGSGFAVPVPDFALRTMTVDEPVTLRAPGPSIVLCTSGAARVDAGDGHVALTPGHAAFVVAGREVTASGGGTVFVATTGSAV